MHYTPQNLFRCTVWICVFTFCLAKDSATDSEVLKQYTKDVETVLSSTLVDELQGAPSNRSAVNVEQTSPRNQEQSGTVNDKKQEIQFDNQIYPYHYQRSYHYHYPPNPNDDPARPIGYTEHFYEPRFRPKSHVSDINHPSYYKSEIYNPFGISASRNANLNANSNSQASSSTNGDVAAAGDAERVDNSEASKVSNEGAAPLPQNSFAHPEIPPPPLHPYPFPSVDFGSYRHGGFGRPLVDHDYFRPAGDASLQPKDPPGYYLPPGDGKFPESNSQRPVESYPPLPPLDPFYPGKEFQGYTENRPTLSDSSLHRSELAPPFFGSFFPPGHHSPFYNGHHPSDHYNNLFGDNFTRNFPLRPSFGGFYPHRNYLPPPASSTPPLSEVKPVETLPPGEPTSQPIPTDKPDDTAAPLAAASNTVFERKLFFPAKNNASPE